MTITIGIFEEHDDNADALWEQCDGPCGRHGDLRFRALDASADHVLLINLPWRPGVRPALPLGERLRGSLRGDMSRRKLEAAWERLNLDREKTSILIHEPPPYVKDMHYEVAHDYASRVFGPDERAGIPTRLRSRWLINGDREGLLQAQPREKTEPLAVVLSGKQLVPGHAERLDFLARLRREGIPLNLFGRGLPASLGSGGSVRSKGAILRPARFALALENFAKGDLYVTDKIWDPLLCWCLPFLWGIEAVDDMIPPESFIRLPDLQEGGVETVKEALGQPRLWEQRLDAIAEARRLILGKLRLVEWIRETIVGG